MPAMPEKSLLACSESAKRNDKKNDRRWLLGTHFHENVFEKVPPLKGQGRRSKNNP